MKDDHNPMGSINVSARAIATIAYQAAIKSYGVVGLASKNLVNDITNMLVKDPTNLKKTIVFTMIQEEKGSPSKNKKAAILFIPITKFNTFL